MRTHSRRKRALPLPVLFVHPPWPQFSFLCLCSLLPIARPERKKEKKMPFQAAAASTAMVPQAHPLFWEAGGEGEQWPTHDAARRERITRGVESDRELTNPSANWQLLGTWAQSHSEGPPDPYERPVRWQALLPGKEDLKHDRTQGEQVLHRQGLHLVCRLCACLHSRSMILKGIEKVWHL